MLPEKTKLDWAKEYLARGFSVIPVDRNKQPLLIWKEFQSRRPSEEELNQWWQKWPHANVAIITGKISGLVVIDLEKAANKDEIEIEYNLRPTALVKTGGGGWHFYYQWKKDQPISNRIRVIPNVDIKAEGGYVVAPPSLHASGNEYEWVLPLEDMIELEEEIPLISNQSNEANETKTDWQALSYESVTTGKRNDTAARYIGKLLHDLSPELWESAGWNELIRWNQQNQPPLPKEELRNTFESVANREFKNRKVKQSEKDEKERKQEIKEAKPLYRFYYYDWRNRSVVDTVMLEPGKPSYVVCNLETGQISIPKDNLFVTSEGEIYQVPPFHIYKHEYKRFILPNKIPDKEISIKEVDSVLDTFINQWFEGPSDMILSLRSYIKYTMRHESHWVKPYIHCIGDKGTGKSRFAQLAAMLCNYGYFHEGSMSAASLVRVIDMTGCTTVLDEGDFIDYADKQILRSILRAGYHYTSSYSVTEQSGKSHNFVNRSFEIGFPKILITREHIDDDALASRTLSLKFLPQDVPAIKLWGTLRRQYEIVQTEAQKIKNLLLSYRWQGLKNEDLMESMPRIEGLSDRSNDTLSPLLYEANEEERKQLVIFFKTRFDELTAEKAEQEEGRLMEILAELADERKGLVGVSRILLKELISRFMDKYSEEYPENMLKARINSRRLSKGFRSIGFTLKKSREGLEFDTVQMMDLLPKFVKKYNIKIEKPILDDIPFGN